MGFRGTEPRGSIYTAAAATTTRTTTTATTTTTTTPKDHSNHDFGAPNSIIVVYIRPLGEYSLRVESVERRVEFPKPRTPKHRSLRQPSMVPLRVL